MKKGSMILLSTIFIVNILNFVFSAYLGRVLTFENFGLVTMINSLWFLASIPFNALYATVNHKVAHMAAKEDVHTSRLFLSQTNKQLLLITLLLSAVWIIFTPLISSFFQIEDFLIPLLFTPIISMGVIVSANKGFLQGTFRFQSIAAIIILESLSKLFFAWLFVTMSHEYWVYTAIPLSVFVSLVLSIGYIWRERIKHKASEKQELRFPKRFFTAALITGLSSTALLSFDVLLAKHYLPPVAAGQYALLSLVGKMVYFFGTLPSVLMISYISSDLGKKIDPRRSFYKLLSATAILSLGAFIGIGILGQWIVPVLLGHKTEVILPYLLTYSSAIVLFAFTGSIVGYHLAKQQYLFPMVSIMLAGIMCMGIVFFHESIAQITQVMLSVSLMSLVVIGMLHLVETLRLFTMKERWFQLRYE